MRIRLLLVLVLIASACAQPGSEPAPTEPTGPTTSTTAAMETTSTLAASAETSTTRPAPNPDRDLAPDFALTLSDGTEYQLASEVRPVYLVFWAEW